MVWATAAKVVRETLGVDTSKAGQLLAGAREGQPIPLPMGVMYYRTDKRYEVMEN